MADCPNCQTPVPEPPASKFCDGCGLALPVLRSANVRARARARAEEPTAVRCPECGLHASARRCRGCGALVRWPEGVIPPDEQGDMPGKGADPALELPDDGMHLELGEPEAEAPPEFEVTDDEA
jgi:hypothetical protein